MVCARLHVPQYFGSPVLIATRRARQGGGVLTSRAVMAEVTSQRAAFAAGVRDTLPLVLGAIPFGIIFGALGVNAGLTPLGTLGMSLFVFAGSAQFIAAGLVAQGVGVGLIVLTTFVVNLRHALYGASLAPYLRHLPQRWLAPLAFWLTDETYAVVIARFQTDPEPRNRRAYYLGSALAMYVNWQLCTVVGIVAGTRLADAAEWGLVAMVVTFVGIVVPWLLSVPMLVCAVVAGGVAVAGHGLPNQLGLMLAAVCAIAAAMLTEAWQARSAERAA